jgi:hypothetical protein
MLLIKKDGSRCFCGDYHLLNTQTHRDVYPMPLIDDVFSQMDVAKWFTTLDCKVAFGILKWTLMMRRRQHSSPKQACMNGLWCQLGFKMQLIFFLRQWQIFSLNGYNNSTRSLDDLNIYMFHGKPISIIYIWYNICEMSTWSSIPTNVCSLLRTSIF